MSVPKDGPCGLLSSSSMSPLCRVSTHIFQRKTMSLGNRLLQILFFVVVYGASISSSCLVFLCFYVSTFRSMCAVPNMAVFCSSLTSGFPVMLLTYFLNDFEMVPFAPIITDITLIIILGSRIVYKHIVMETTILIIIIIIVVVVVVVVVGVRSNISRTFSSTLYSVESDAKLSLKTCAFQE